MANIAIYNVREDGLISDFTRFGLLVFCVCVLVFPITSDYIFSIIFKARQTRRLYAESKK